MGTSFGRYKVAEELGRGAMGVVYRAVDPAIGRSVAIKAINRSYLESLGVRPEEYAERFQREAQVAGALNHPHIVKIFDLGPDYLVMEYVEGQTLAALLRARGRLPHATALRILEQAAAAIDHAHASGIVHRDIKPANVMVRPDGSVKVMDFGLARIESSTLTAAGEVLGSAAYMAPEVVLGQPADARSDNFSLGVVAYELLTGLRPFAGPTVSAIIQSVVRTTPRPVRELDATLPPEVDTVFARALAKEPGERYPLAGDFARALAAAPWGESAGAGVPLDSSATADAGQATVILATASTILPAAEPAAEEATTILTVDAEELAAPDESPAASAADEAGGAETSAATVILARPPVAEPPAAPTAEHAVDPSSATAKLKTPRMAPPPAPPAPPAPMPHEPSAGEPAATVILNASSPPAPAEQETTGATVILKGAPARPAPAAHEPSAGEPAATVVLKAPSPAGPPASTEGEGPAATVVLKAPSAPPSAPAATAAAVGAADPTLVKSAPQVSRAAAPPPPPPAPVAPPTATRGAKPAAPAPAMKPAAPAAKPPAARKSSSVGWILGVTAVILVLFGAAVGGFFWLVRSQNAKDAAASPAPVAESPAPPSSEAATPPEVEPAPEAEASPAAEGEAVPAAMAPQPATLLVTSDPAGATVSLGRRRRGRTPLRLSIPPGTAAVSVEKDGFKPWRETTRLKPGETRTLEARLEPLAPPRTAPAVPPPPPATPAVREGDLVALGPDVTPPRKLSGDSPNIPDRVRRRLAGSAVVEFVVGIDGRVSDAKVVESINLVVDKAVLDAVATWRYEPARSRGVRVRVTQRAKFTFVAQ